MAFLKLTRIATVSILTAALFQPLATAEPKQEAKSEYALKAVFLYNFCRFIEWPKSAFPAPDSPIIIGVLGEDPFGALLKEAVQGETQLDRPIQIEYYRKPDAIGNCHLLFVSRSETGRLEAIFAAVAGKSVVTVGETDAFLDRGGMIALTAARNRIRLTMNPAIMRAASLDVSSKLLRIAEVKP
jgi:hypothetical protein